MSDAPHPSKYASYRIKFNIDGGYWAVQKRFLGFFWRTVLIDETYDDTFDSLKTYIKGGKPRYKDTYTYLDATGKVIW